MSTRRALRFLVGGWDEFAIAAALVHFRLTGDIAEEDAYVLVALRRSRNDLADATRVELRDYLAGMNDAQMRGVVNNVKGIAHEIYYVAAENADGDSTTAEMFEDTNHPDYDVVLLDSATGERREIQLKATSSPSYVREAIAELGAENVYATNEVARVVGVTGTGITNVELTADVRQVIDHLIDAPAPISYVWAVSACALPMLLLVFVARLARRRISGGAFLRGVSMWGVVKVAKITAFLVAFGIAGLGLAAVAALSLKLAYEAFRAMRPTRPTVNGGATPDA
jgi:hypothetical protein